MLVKVIVEFRIRSYRIILSAHQHQIVIVITSQHLFHACDVAFSDTVTTPNDVKPVLYKMNMRQIGYILERPLVDILIDVDIDEIIGTI
jgi:hypothetical protein